MSRAMAEAFVRNLKLFNAKERDHLMRYAYLSASTRETGACASIGTGGYGAPGVHSGECLAVQSAACSQSRW